MEKIKFKDLEWYVLEKDEENIKLLLADVLDEEHIKKYVDDEWYREGFEVRHSSIIRANADGWEDSYIKNVVLGNFKKDLGIDCEVTLLTEDEALNLDKEIRCCNEWYWTKTIIEDDTYLYFACVHDIGYNSDNNASDTNGVRPVLSTKISNLELKGEKIMENKLEYYAMMNDFNSNELIRINIFNNTKFSDGVDKLLKKFVSYENFKEELIKLLRYCFRSRAEYEIIVKDLFEKQKGTKIDIYYQVEKNIDILANYIINEHNKNINKK